MSQARANQKPGSRYAVAGSKRIDKPTYDAMYAAYVERQSASHVAAQCGVSRETATRAIEVGYPKHGWAPLRERLTAVNRQAAQQEDYGLVEAHRESLQAVRAYKKRYIQALETEEVTDANIAGLERFVKLETFVLGGADRRVAVQAHVAHTHQAVIEAMPDHLLEEFIKTGKSSIEMDRIAEAVWESKKR